MRQEYFSNDAYGARFDQSVPRLMAMVVVYYTSDENVVLVDIVGSLTIGFNLVHVRNEKLSDVSCLT